MYTRRWLVSGMLLAALSAAQETPASLQVTGAVKQPLTLSADDLSRMPRASVQAKSNAAEITYQGVWISDILTKAGVPAGKELRGKALASYVLAQAQDGYQVVFSLGELDPAIADSRVLIADTADGKALSGAQGRFRLVPSNDKSGVRSVRMLTKLEVVQLGK